MLFRFDPVSVAFIGRGQRSKFVVTCGKESQEETICDSETEYYGQQCELPVTDAQSCRRLGVTKCLRPILFFVPEWSVRPRVGAFVVVL